MGVDVLTGVIVSAHALLGYWIGNHLAQRQRHLHQLLAGLFGFVCGVAFGFGVSYLSAILLRSSTPPASGIAILSWVVFIVPWVLILKTVEWHAEGKSRDYQAVAGFLALLVASTVGIGLNYLFFVLIPGREVPTSLPLAYWLGALGGFIYMALLLRIVYALAMRSVPPKLSEP